MTPFKLEQLQKLSERIDDLEEFFKFSFNKKGTLRASIFSFHIFTADKRADIDLAQYPEMRTEIITVMQKHLKLMKQAYDEAQKG